MELREYLAVMRKWVWLFVLSTAVAAVGAWVGTWFMARTYMSESTIMVGRAIDSPDVNAQAIYLSNQLAQTYATMAVREPVLQAVVDTLGLQTDWRTLEGMVKASPQPGSPMFEIRVVATNPELAQRLAAEVGNQLIQQSATQRQLTTLKDQTFLREQLDKLQASIDQTDAEIDEIQQKIDLETSARGISELQQRLGAKQAQRDRYQERYVELRTSFEGSDVNALSVIEPATPALQVGPNVRMNILLAALLGLALAFGAVLLMEYLDDTVKTPEEVERRLGLTGLGTIDRFEGVQNRADGLVTVASPRSPSAEAYRTLRTNLQFAMLQRPRRPLVVTSANPGEGKSTTVANLGVVLAQGDRNVILVDADLRKPSMHRFYGLTNNVGLTTLILDDSARPADALRPVDGVPGLRVLTSGPLPPNPAEVLGSAAMQRVLADLQAEADIVILDTPPTLLVTDAAILGHDAAGTLLVFDCGATRTDTARKAIEGLHKAGVEILGAVVNKLDRVRLGGYYRYSYYRYQYGDYGEYYGSADGAGSNGAGPGGPGSAADGPAREKGQPRPAPRPVLGWRRWVTDRVSTLLG
ncbi:MAG: polysaccharide biosynthesis tyrosine autokinase [Chloroflexi bacterium CFX6]|nr:polysaccharide biosynthesis tyrosine autokinase [Chloroflexi bacterium CFX6]